jgi:DNA-binding response OmpR family regulator
VILLIDNDLAATSRLERMLRYTGHDAMSVQDGMEALNLLSARRPQLILLDLNLPGAVSGMLVLQSIRKDPDFASVPIWIYSEEFSQDVVVRALRSGAQEYVIKGTIGYMSLVSRIDALLKNSRG